MARIRSIHPGLLTDEAFMTLTINRPVAIPLLLGLWIEADDSGTFEWKPLTLKARILPAVSEDIGALLSDLVSLNFIKRFEIDGKSFGVIRNFVRFQRPKSPKDIHPFSEDMRSYAGFTEDGVRPNAGTGRPPSVDDNELVSSEFGTHSEKSPQRKEEGGKRKEKEEKDNSLRSLTAREMENFANEFYDAYPKHVDPIDAKKKFAIRVKAGANPQHIVEAAKRFAEAHRRAGTDKKFIPAPAVWLNKGGYDSEDLPRAPPSRSPFVDERGYAITA